MRRDIGMVLAGLGAFLIVLAIALPTYIAGHVIKFPLNYYYKATLVGTNATYFSAPLVKEVTGANINAIYTLKGLGNQGNSSTAVWQVFTDLYDTAYPSPSQAIELQSTTVAFDRKNGDLKNCCGANFLGKPVNWSGIVGYVFPMNTQKTTYNVYNTTLAKTVPFTYAGTDNVDGISTYRFVSNVAPVKVGFTPLSPNDPQYYGVDQTYWIDPETGALLKVLETQNSYLVNPITGAPVPGDTLLHVTLAPTPASVQAIVNIDNSGRLKILLFETIMPIVLGVLGAIILVWGVLMARRRPDLTESSGFGGTTGDLSAAAPPEQTAPQTAQTAPITPAGDGTASEPTSRRGGKHAAGSTIGIVPGMDTAPAEKTTTEAASESADGQQPDPSA